MCRYCYNNNSKNASEATLARNKEFAEKFGIDLKKATCEELENAREKKILSASEIRISNEHQLVWDLNQFSFYKNEKISETIHPGLWLNGKSCYEAGVFEVVEGSIYQVRGLDLSNLTIIRSKTGWIVQDVMTTVETSSKALDLLSEALHEDVRSKIRAVIISHSHWDHFGGIKGVVDEEQVGLEEEGKIPIYVPAGFDAECIKEYIFAGTAMDRRNDFQFARTIGVGEKEVVSGGLGLDHPKGTASFITPTNYVTENGIRYIDGLKVEFQLTPGTEAPAEMNNYFEDYKALWIAENCCGTLHNLYPIRGAQLRDSSAWASYIIEAIELFADRTEVVFQSHHWPHFNTKENPQNVRTYLENNAAIYRYIHDQTLHLANKGRTAKEIAKEIAIPDALGKNWYTRPYYGSVEINARAVYTKYLGFYNANPVDLDPLTELEEAKAFMDYVGSVERIISKAEEDFEKGNYRLVADIMNKVVYVQPDNSKARQLCADAFEQLAYQSESSIWRNAYLEGAKELRFGTPARGRVGIKNRDMMLRMTPKQVLEYLGISLNGEKVAELDILYRFVFVKKEISGEKKWHYKGEPVCAEKVFLVHLYKGTLLVYKDQPDVHAVTVLAGKERFFELSEKKYETIKAEFETDNREAFEIFEKGLEDLSSSGQFAIIEP